VTRERKYGELKRDGLPRPKSALLAGGPVIDGDRVKAASDRWLPQTKGVSDEPPRGPLDALLGEATVVGLLYQAYWKPKPRSDGSTLPGFADWSEGPLLHAHSGYELLELVTAIA
jgi:hypothetical protein